MQRRNLFIGIVLITFGVLFLLDNLGIAEMGDVIHNFWPLILILWGLSIVLRGRTKSPTMHAEVAQSIEHELLHQSSVFGSMFVSVTSQNFKGGSVSTVFGDCDIDLSHSVIAEGEHELRVHGVFGDTSIILPQGAGVAVTASSTFGSITVLGQRKDGMMSDLQVTSNEYQASTKRLKISVSKVFGDARIG